MRVILIMFTLFGCLCFGQEDLLSKKSKVGVGENLFLLVEIESFDPNRHNVIHCETSCDDPLWRASVTRVYLKNCIFKYLNPTCVREI